MIKSGFLAIVLTSSAACSTVVATDSVEESMPAFRCGKDAPTTAAGYQDLWNGINRNFWGAGDFNQSVGMGRRNGRMVRVYINADTLKNGGKMAHSTAIVQVGGCRKVSFEGEQLLPNGQLDSERRRIYYWPEDVWRVRDTQLMKIRARATVTVGEGVWGFLDKGWSRVGLLRLTDFGNVKFIRWTTRRQYSAAPPGSYFETVPASDPAHFYYSWKRHHQLPNGDWLWTKCQNQEGPLAGGWENYAPIWESHNRDWLPFPEWTGESWRGLS